MADSTARAPALPRPTAAWWVEADQEWVYGDKDADGRLTGVVRYWDAEGRLISEAAHVAGQPHGDAVRYYPGGEVAQVCRYREGRIIGVRTIYRPPAGAGVERERVVEQRFRERPEAVVVYECEYADNGDLVATRFRDHAGRELDGNSQPIGARPPGVTDHASRTASGWVAMRRDQATDELLEWIEWDSRGQLVRERRGDLERRWSGGRIASHGRHVPTPDGKHRERDGAWCYGDPASGHYRISTMAMGRELERRWHQHGLQRTGSVAVLGDHDTRYLGSHRELEVGCWRVTTTAGELVDELELGPALSDAALLALPAMADVPVDADALAAGIAGRCDAAALCARIRLAARRGDAGPITEVACRGERWTLLDPDGHDLEPRSLLSQRSLCARLAAVRWGEPWHDMLELVGGWLLEQGRPHAAIDFLDAAVLMGGAPSATRGACLHQLGRSAEVAGAIDARERALLDGFRADPRRAARAVADQLAAAAPARARVLRAFADGEAPAPSDVAAFQDALPEALGEALADGVARGFSSDACLALEAEAFVEHADDVARLWPLATELELAYASRVMTRLAAAPALARFRGLTFVDTYLFDDGAAKLAGSAHVAQLESLGLFGTSLHDDDLAAILEPGRFPRLVDLDLGNPREDQHYTLAGLRPIRAASFAQQLEILGLRRRYFDDGVIDVVVGLPALHSLDLDGNCLTDAGLVALAALPHRFTRLDLGHGEFGARGIAALAASPVLERCVTLVLDGNALGDDGFAAVVGSPHLRGLARLSLKGGFGDRARPDHTFAQALANAAFTASLTELELSLASLGPDGARALARAPFQRLERLGLYGNKIGDDGAIALLGSPAIRHVQFLDLGNNDLTDASGVALVESPYADALLHVQLGGAELAPRTRDRLQQRFAGRIQLRYPWAP